MKPEIEAVFLDVDKEALRAKLEKLGAKLIAKERKMKRVVFDQGEHAFARVRDEGDKIVATHKRFDDHSITGAKEVNVVVDDIYEMYYEGVTAKEVRHWPKIVFEEMPEGLKGKVMRKRG